MVEFRQPLFLLHWIYLSGSRCCQATLLGSNQTLTYIPLARLHGLAMIIVSEKANQALTKRHNARLVLKTIYDHEPVSRAEVARMTELTATTVSHLISELINDGVAAEVGSVASDRGKPPTLVALCKDARHVIALNLAQTAFRGGIFNLRGELLHHQIAPATGLVGEAAVQLVYQLVESLLAQTDRPLLGIGVGAPGVIDLGQGIISRAVNLQWYEVPLAQLLHQRYALPIHIVNDNQATLLAEHLFGRYKQAPDLVVVRIGRGIGAGLLVDGQLVRSHGAGEIGHVMVVEEGERCSCGQRGCLETVASSRAILQRAQQLLPAHPNSHLARLVAERGWEMQSVVDAFAAGDAFLTPLLDTAGEALGVTIAHLVSLLGPSHILLSGSVTGFGEPLLSRVRHEVQRRSLTAQLRATEIDLATLSSDSILLGATALLLKQELGLF
jgi:N-acetylglucosamine repressor